MMTLPDPNTVPIWVVYRYPRDFPNHFVVRVQYPMPGFILVEPTACLYETEVEAHFDCEAKGLIYVARHPDDDFSIIGFWV